MKIERTILINKPVVQVFNYIIDVKKAVYWAGLVKEVNITSGEPVRLGTQGYNKMKLMLISAEVGWKITGIEPNKSFTVKSTFGPVNGAYYYRFEPHEDKTRLNVTVVVEPRGVYKVLESAVSPTMAPQITRDLENLKELLENGVIKH